MNLHIFGHSICRSATGTQKPTFVDMLSATYKLPNTNIHQADCGSEERILYYLKKTKDIDVAIIFHGFPSHVFVPTLERDLPANSFDDLFKKLEMMRHLNHVSSDSTEPDIKLISPAELKIAYDYFLKYFHTHDLNINRYHGALVQIDQYLLYKKIPAIHCTLEGSMPTWFKFTSGIHDTEITRLQKSDSLYRTMLSDNRINHEGNTLIANKLIKYIETLGCLTGIDPVLPLSQSRVQATTLKTP